MPDESAGESRPQPADRSQASERSEPGQQEKGGSTAGAAAEVRKPPQDSPVGDVPERVAGQSLRNKVSSKDRPDDVGDAGDGDIAAAVGQQLRTKQLGDRTIDRAKRSAISMGEGPAYYVEQQVINHAGRRLVVQKQFLDRGGDVDPAVEPYVPVDGFEDMVESLLEKGLLVLRGAPGTGRNGTAEALLRRARCDRIGRVSVNDDDLFDILYDRLVNPQGGQSPLMGKREGYIVDRAGNAMSEAGLEGLAAAVKAAEALVVVIDDAGQEPVAPGFERFHPWPASRMEILAKHLERLLIKHVKGCTEASCNTASAAQYRKRVLEHQIMPSRLNVEPSVLRIVGMARYLAKSVHHEKDKSVAQILDGWDDSPRLLAREILRGNAPEDKPHLIPYQQAFRISYAVFHGLPLAYVFGAAEILLEEITGAETRKRPLKSRIFDGNVEALLHPGMVAGTADSDEVPPRRAQLAAESLIVSILEVAWHDYDRLRRPLMGWFDALAGSQVAEVRIRTAQIVGLVATFDYDDVFQNLVKGWARSKAFYRNSAAIAMDQVYRNESSSDVARSQVGKWSRSGSETEQDTAARFCGLRVERGDIGTAIETLSRLGSQPQLRRGTSVAVAMSLLFLNDHVDEVLDTLGRWIVSDNTYLPNHAVKTLLILTDSGQVGSRSRPILSGLAEQDDQRRAAIVKMWRRALASRMVGRRSWDALRAWLAEADENDATAALMESLALQIFTDALAPRARFNIAVWRKRSPHIRLFERLHGPLSNTKGR